MSLAVENLPALGVGASLSLSAKPDPVTLIQLKNGPSFIEYAGLANVEKVINEIEKVRQTGASVLYHPSYINFCGSFPNSKHWLEATAKHVKTVNSAWFAQDCAYCYWQEGFGYSSQFGYFVPPILNRTSLKFAIERVKEVQAVVQVPVALEPPPMSFIIGHMPLLEFFKELVEATDAAILLDIGHLISYEMASGRKITDEIIKLPCERVIELHIAGGRIKESELGPIYVDAHEDSISDQSWEMLEFLLRKLPNVKAICYECEGVEQVKIMDVLAKLREIVLHNSLSTGLITALGGKQ